MPKMPNQSGVVLEIPYNMFETAYAETSGSCNVSTKFFGSEPTVGPVRCQIVAAGGHGTILGGRSLPNKRIVFFFQFNLFGCASPQFYSCCTVWRQIIWQ